MQRVCRGERAFLISLARRDDVREIGTIPTLKPEELEPVVTLFVASAAYLLYHYAPARFGVFQKRIWGAFVLGVVPAAIAMIAFGRGFAEIGLGGGPVLLTLGAALGIWAITLPATYGASKNRKMWAEYPQLRRELWDRKTYIENAATWAIYLFGYELFFRGVFLFTMERWVGLWPAIAIVNIAYVYAHLTKNAGETWGTIPMGVVFSLASWWLGGIWAPVLAHTAIASSADFFMIRARQRATREESAGESR